MSLLLLLGFESAAAPAPEPSPPTHVYDTGLPKPQRTLIREAIVRRLAPLLKANGGYLQAVVELPKPAQRVDPGSDDESMLFHYLNGRAPAVGVALGRRATESSGMLATEARSTLDVHVYVVSQHGRDHVQGRLATDVVAATDLTKDPGIETMLEHVEQFLQGHHPKDENGDNIATVDVLRGVDENDLDTLPDISVWEQRYELGIERVINPARAIKQLVTSIQGRHTESGMSGVPNETHELAPLITLANLLPEES